LGRGSGHARVRHPRGDGGGSPSNLREAVELWLSVDTTDAGIAQNDRIIELAL
jgi:hypothetical protein